MAVARIVLKNVHIPSTTALGALHPEGRVKGLQAGANVIMPNFTPEPYKSLYKIYPIGNNKTAVDISAIESMLNQIGRKIGEGKGHTLKWKN